MIALAAPERATRSLCDVVDGEPMLDEMLVSVWEGLTARRPAPCPVCGEEMRPEYGAHSRPIGGRCGGCGSTLY